MYPKFPIGTLVYFTANGGVYRAEVTAIHAISTSPAVWELSYKLSGWADLHSQDALFSYPDTAFAHLEALGPDPL
jgi:hypothetical protein